MKLGFIGAGQMARALASGISKSDATAEFCAYDPDPTAIETFQLVVASDRFESCDSNRDVVENSQIVFIAVKPQVASTALDGLQDSATDGAVFISVVAGLPLVQLIRLLGSDRIVRAMPNTPCLIGKGAIAVCSSAGVSSEQHRTVKDLLAKVGIVVDVLESQLDAVTGLSGSGPAFVYTFVEAMIDGGVLAGLPRGISKQLAMQTIIGSMELLQGSGQHPATLRDQVTSPGGTTIHGMAQLEQRGFRDSVHSAIQAATDRASELSTQS